MTEGRSGRAATAIAHVRGRADIVLLTACLMAAACLFPARTHAGVFSDIKRFFESRAEASTPTNPLSVQTLPLVRPAMNHDPNPAKGGASVLVEDGVVVRAQDSPGGSDVANAKNTSISIYVVREGDTLSEIAEMFGVSVNTIKWANDIPPSGTIRVGQVLTILPIDGVKYTVKTGDTLQSIAKQFGGDVDEIVNFNGLAGPLAVGMELTIPNGEIAAPAPKPASASSVARSSDPTPSPTYSGYYARPIAGGMRTQGVHGYNAVDLAAPVGTPITASASGDVIVSREGGWNGGYGSYVVIRHDNGTQTLYAHASSVIVGVGQHVVQGQVVGYVGQSGKATGPHLHFEIRGGPRNPF
ncbi:MAG TPA: M23 family metallopeptidase [Candidatus Paceibacterota bacterium]|nr:M23 family metallopeptidase [Candidatus Paceibacterota bacterium]